MRRGLLNTTSLTPSSYVESTRSSQRASLNMSHIMNQTEVRLQEKEIDIDLGYAERGIIISNPMRIDGSSVSIDSTDVDQDELRRALLFWDRLIWPSTSGIYIDGGPDMDFLVGEGKLLRPNFLVNGDCAIGLSMAFSETFRILEHRAPGQWIMSGGVNSLKYHGRGVEEGRGVFADLINAIPIPDRTMPLEDIIIFRSKREPEVIALRTAIEELYQNWKNSEDKDNQFKLALTKIDLASVDMVRVAREGNHPFQMSSWKVSFNATPDIVRAAAGFLSASGPLELGTLASLFAGAVSSTISVGSGIGLRTAKTDSPFQYVATIESKLY